MARLKNLLAEAGFSRFNPASILSMTLLIAGLASAWASALTHVAAFAVAVAISSLSFAYELLAARARQRQRDLAKAWPAAIDTLLSGTIASVQLSEGIFELAKNAPKRLRPYFVMTHNSLENGYPQNVALTELKLALSMRYSDATIELLLLTSDIGSRSLSSELRSQAKQIRQELALWSEIESKQAWVVATAKIALIAPWVIVALLSSRPENATAYNSPAGVGILLCGLAISIFAYRLIHFIGALPLAPRVFATQDAEVQP
jgi:tight adherence protein B